MRYYYPDKTDSFSAKKQFLNEQKKIANHCFKNIRGRGFVIFDTKEDVNEWWNEHTGKYFYMEEPRKGEIFTKDNAIKEIENTYVSQIETFLNNRDYTMPFLLIGLPSGYSNPLSLTFIPAVEEKYFPRRFYVHYTPHSMNISNMSNVEIKNNLLNSLYNYFYRERFQKRIENSK